MVQAVKALCRYCTEFVEPGRVRCSHCDGYRFPSRRQARREARKAKQQEKVMFLRLLTGFVLAFLITWMVIVLLFTEAVCKGLY